MSRRVARPRIRRFPHRAAVRHRGAAPRPVRRAQPRPDDQHARAVGGDAADPHRRPPDLPGQRPPGPDTVSVLGGPRQRMDLVTALRGWIDRLDRGRPRGAASIPKGETRQAGRAGERRPRCCESQENATTAALRSLGIPVTDARRGRPASRRLAVGGQAAAGRRDRLGRRRRRSPAGRACASAVTRAPARRRRSPFVVETRREARARSPSRPAQGARRPHRCVGIEIRDEADYPFTVDIGLKDVGGPSAGLMFALGIVDKLTPGSLTGGNVRRRHRNDRRQRQGRRRSAASRRR